MRQKPISSSVDSPHDPSFRHNHQSALVTIRVADIRTDDRHPRKWSKRDRERADKIYEKWGASLPPPSIDEENFLVGGHLLVEAARRAGVETVQVVRLIGLASTDRQKEAIAYQRLMESGTWDGAMLFELIDEFEIADPDFRIDDIGFDISEFEGIAKPAKAETEDELPDIEEKAVSEIGDIWEMEGRHRVACADSTDADAYRQLFGDEQADAVISDPPFGCPVENHISKSGRHREFVQASGEMSSAELFEFFLAWLALIKSICRPGALIYLFIDFRSQPILHNAATTLFGALLNLIVWRKDRGGMGSMYRSAHELILLYRAPGAQHTNNVMLGATAAIAPTSGRHRVRRRAGAESRATCSTTIRPRSPC